MSSDTCSGRLFSAVGDADKGGDASGKHLGKWEEKKGAKTFAPSFSIHRRRPRHLLALARGRKNDSKKESVHCTTVSLMTRY